MTLRNRLKNISAKGIWKDTLWALTIISIALTLYFAIQYHKMNPLSAIELTIADIEGTRNLISEDVALGRIEQFLGGTIEQVKLEDVNVLELEKALSNDSRIELAEVYIDGNNILHVYLKQREPIARVMSDNGEDYYIDRLGEKVATVKNSAIRVPIITGNISPYHEDWKMEEGHTMHDIMALTKSIRKDDFLKALIEQIEIEDAEHITLIPKVGKQKISFGSIEDIELKLQNLKISYKKLLPAKGWTKYDTINVSISNQLRGVS